MIASERVYPAASLIKIPIMIEAFIQAEAGNLFLEQLVEVPPDKKVGGSGILRT